MAAAGTKKVYIGIIGVGGVGTCFLKQLKTLRERLASVPRPTDLSLVFMSRSNANIYTADYSHIPIEESVSLLAKSTQELLPISGVIDYLAAAPGIPILVDNTSSQDVADQYPNFLSHGVNVVTPNKKAFSSSYELWEKIFAAAAASGAKVYHESSVGAGLPVIKTIRDLVDTGDEIRKIEGVFSGTMSFLFNSFAPTEGQGGKWSDEVRKAKDLGYTEPDPRDDLNGLDVARKLTILARLSGLKVQSPTSFPVQSLIPKELESCTSGEEFMQKLPEFDEQMDRVNIAAAVGGKVVRYVGSIDVAKNEVKVGLETFEKTHPIAALKGSDNIISIYTKRYGDNPLTIQGAGAGGDVTAMGVTADLLTVIVA